MGKVILGLPHVDSKDFALGQRKVEEYRPQSVGIELPRDYDRRESIGITNKPFSDLASYLKSRGIKVIYLEDPRLWDYNQALREAKAVVIGKKERAQLEKDLADIRREIKEDEQKGAPVDDLKHAESMYRSALDILNKNPTKEQMEEMWKNCMDEREKYVLESVKKDNPDMLIVGSAHVANLKDRLPSYRAEAYGRKDLKK